MRRRWQARDLDAKIAFVGMGALLAGAIAVRVWLVVSYGPAFLGFPDCGAYVLAATKGIFLATQHPAGYPLFLRVIRHLSSDMSPVVAVQHAIGIATGLLLYSAVRRTGARPWLGLLPAVVVFYGGTGLMLEHSLLADTLFAFLQAVGVYAAIRALYDAPLRWPLLAGLAIGVSFWIKPVAISSAALIPLVLLCAAPGGVRRRLLSALATSMVVLVTVLAYVGAQYHFTGYLGYERDGAWNVYGQVATFVDCSKFTPPSGTGFLCPSQPLGHRYSQLYYQNSPKAPAYEHFGPPWEASESADTLIERFSAAAIEHEPVGYAKSIVRGLGRYIFPSAGEGYTPQGLREALISKVYVLRYHVEFTPFYPDSIGYFGSAAKAHALSVYESHTLVQGPLLILLLAAAIAGPFTLPRRMRWAAVIFTLTAFLSIVFAVAGNSYDARYAYPTFGPLAAGAALGAWGIGSLLARTMRRRGVRPGQRPESPSELDAGRQLK
jgi:hypothetical protein